MCWLHRAVPDLTPSTLPALSTAPPSSSSTPIPLAASATPSLSTDTALSTILAAINNLESHLAAQNTTTHNDLQQLRHSNINRLDVLEASCSANAASIKTTHDFATTELVSLAA
eukprot:GHVN01026111.1.p2 GENE.GHVN01026111.1~~GHVN01026111.1.p2  ORF type:complete len:114 (+),score=23.64 GHVN01026111.1:109-450(+)